MIVHEHHMRNKCSALLKKAEHLQKVTHQQMQVIFIIFFFAKEYPSFYISKHICNDSEINNI